MSHQHLFLFVLCTLSLCLQMNDIVDASQSSTRELQEQIDIYKEKNRRELTELQRLLKERGLELEKYLLTTKTLQEEVQWASSGLARVMMPHIRILRLHSRSEWSNPNHHSSSEASHAVEETNHCPD